jgi:aspartate kinase
VGVVVKKFGGTLLEDTRKIDRVARVVAQAKETGEEIVCVVSAMGDTTNRLFSLAREISSNPPIRELDMLLTAGERISISLLSMAINSLGYEAISFTGSQSGIITDDRHTRAKILRMTPYRIREELARGRVVVVAGFQGVSEGKEITTLGRGGSDITAVALSKSLDCSECQLYKEVGGIYSVDPKLVARAKKMETISYGEMLELAALGADVVHPRAIEIAERDGIRLHIRSLNGEVGTMIEAGNPMIEKAKVRGIAVDEKIAMLTLTGVPRSSGLLEQAVSVLAQSGVPVKLFFHGAGTEACNLCFILREDDCDLAVSLMEGIEGLKIDQMICEREAAQVSLIGSGICTDEKILSGIFSTVTAEGVHIDAVYTSEARVSLVVKREKVILVVDLLAKEFDLIS